MQGDTGTYVMVHTLSILVGNLADPDPWNPYHFPGSGSVSKNGWIRNSDPYQIIWIRIQPKQWKTVNNFNLFTLI